VECGFTRRYSIGFKHEGDRMTHARWPELPFITWAETAATLQLWTQVVGKIRLARTPWLNHSWHVTLYVSARGLTTGPIPDGGRTFQIDFDFIDHVLWLRTSDGQYRQVMLTSTTEKGVSVAKFYGEVMAALRDLGIDVTINTMPCELPECTTCWRASAPVSSARPARCISSGVRSIWR
jgi:hypothetical protein